MNAKGWELFKKWEAIYEKELQLLREEMNDPEYEEGWSIIDDYDFVKTIDDEIGLLVFGYDDGIDYYFDFWEQHGGLNEVCFTDIDGNDYTFAEVKERIVPYYEE